MSLPPPMLAKRVARDVVTDSDNDKEVTVKKPKKEASAKAKKKTKPIEEKTLADDKENKKKEKKPKKEKKTKEQQETEKEKKAISKKETTVKDDKGEKYDPSKLINPNDVYLEFHEGETHNKFYRIEREGTNVTVRWGTVGKKINVRVYPYDTVEKAEDIARTMEADKRDKGYRNKP